MNTFHKDYLYSILFWYLFVLSPCIQKLFQPSTTFTSSPEALIYSLIFFALEIANATTGFRNIPGGNNSDCTKSDKAKMYHYYLNSIRKAAKKKFFS